MARTPAVQEQQHQVVIYEAKGGQKIQLSLAIVRDFLVTGKKELVTDQEIVFFMGICKARGLNPFAKDCYLIKYSQDPAAIVTAIDFYRSRARAQKDCVGWEKGVICLKKDGTLRYSHGLVLADEEVVGGWFKGQPSGWSFPQDLEVNLREFVKKTSDGRVTKFWQNPAMMIMKVAESQGLRTLWPDEFRGTVTAEEIGELSEALTGGELLPEGGGPSTLALEPPDTTKFHHLVDGKLKEMSPERQQEVADHLKVFLNENAERMSTEKKKVTPEDLMVKCAEFFEPYVDDAKQQQLGTWKKFLAWEESPNRPWNQEAKPPTGTYGECFAHGRFSGDECPVCAKEQKAPVIPGAEGGPSEKAESEAAAGDNAGEASEETFEDRIERLWGLVMKKSPPTKAMKDACGVTMRNTITEENIDAFETFITEYEKK